MIALNRLTSSGAANPKIFGLGGAGSNVVDRLILDGFPANQTIVLNTDLQALHGSVAGEKLHLGKLTTRGLGAGGDPELGYASAAEATEEVNAALADTDLVFLCAGLGGGTGSGAAPLVAHLARAAGATVIAVVTLPFTFEGKRRSSQAAEALAQLEQQANLVLCFENDAMASIVAPSAGIQQAFVTTDQTLSQAIRAILAIVQRRGLLNIGLDDLSAAMGRPRSGGGVRCLFGHGESDTANRAHEALERAIRNPLMQKGRMLGEARHVLVHVAGGAELTLNEVSVLMEEFNRHVADSARVSFGVATDAKLGRRIAVSILCTTTASAKAEAPAGGESGIHAPLATPADPGEAKGYFAEILDETVRPPETRSVAAAMEFDQSPNEAAPVASAAPAAPVPIPVAVPAARTRSAPRPSQASPKKEEKAEQMTLEPVNRGRFEKSEPTIVDGEDLDVPTFLRKNARR